MRRSLAVALLALSFSATTAGKGGAAPRDRDSFKFRTVSDTGERVHAEVSYICDDGTLAHGPHPQVAWGYSGNTYTVDAVAHSIQKLDALWSLYGLHLTDDAKAFLYAEYSEAHLACWGVSAPVPDGY